MRVRSITALLVMAMLVGCTSARNPGGGSEGDASGRRPEVANQNLVPVAPGPDAVAPVDLNGILPPDRQTVWNPGLSAVGGIPNRTTTCATLSPSGGDDTRAIQQALDTCPADQVVQLERGTYGVSGEGLAITRSNITLRGRGLETRLVQRGANYPVVIMGRRWPKYTQPVDVARDATQGSTRIELGSNPGLQVGEIVTVDQVTDPSLSVWSPRSPPGHESRGWFGRPDRPIGQVLEVKSVEANSVTFTTPVHLHFRTANKAQLVRMSDDPDGPPRPAVRYSGIEDLHVSGGEGGDGGGNIHLFGAAYSWVKNVESEASLGASVNLEGTFRCELRDSYLHSTKDPNPGGGGYGIVLDRYASDNLIENNISWNFNKVMVMRTTGGGNVIGYNYMEDAYGAGYPTIVETGLNASHMTTPHHELFEGNQSFNFDSDSTWGNSIYITVFRNHLTGTRRSIAPLRLTDEMNRRAVGLTVGHWWYSFIGNVLGSPGQAAPPGARFVYETTNFDDDAIIPMWKLGYDGEDGRKPPDPKVLATTIRHGNYDFVTNRVAWDGAQPKILPPSLYLKEKPAFFGPETWPWLEAESGGVRSLPARARFDRVPRR